jgi:folate-binding protein YgfZ
MTVALRDPWGLVVVSGPDATSYLQSLVSQDLEPLAIDASAESMLLTPQGKLDVLFRITRVADDEWWLDTEPEYGPRLAASLTRFRIRVKAEIDDRTADTALVSSITRDDPAAISGIGDSARVLRTPWGFDHLAPRADLDVQPTWSAEQLEVFRIEQGVPKLGVDIDEKTIPQEAFLERDAVSFTKGCFLGQELVTRIDTRGHVNKYLRRLAVDGSVVPPRSASIEVDGKDVGTVTSSAAVPGEGRVVALGMVRREVEPPADVTIRWDAGEARATVLTPPTGR